VIAPSAIHIGSVQAMLTRSDVSLAIQDIHTAKGLGAFTGAHTADVVKDAGLSYVIVGHSERRSIFHESCEQSALKAKVAIEAGLHVIFCIGESLSEREAGQTLSVCRTQLQALVDVVPVEAWSKIILAYEPVWAIGTGKVATPEQAQEVHSELRAWFKTTVSETVAADLRIIYGGSVNVSMLWYDRDECEIWMTCVVET
jgi:triosephosphate isomerase (TIM)